MPGDVRVEMSDGVAVVRMERPPANALSPELLDEDAGLMRDLRADPPEAVVLTGSGGFFSGGVDLKLAPAERDEGQRSMVAGINRLFIDWYSFPRPVVAAVNGHAVAGGMILALCADRRVGCDSATYGLTELRVGIPYPAAAIACVRAELSPGAARRLVLEAELVDAGSALAHGLVDELVPADAVFERGLAVARELATLPGATYETVKEQLRGPEITAMREAAERDPMSEGWIR